jgi:hypothetical protein
MGDEPDTAALGALTDALTGLSAAQRLDALKQAVIRNGGRWDLPSELPGIYRPALVSLQVFGVYAMAETLEELPRNWMRAARNVLAARENEEDHNGRY